MRQPAVPADEDDTGGQPIFLIRPAENVYSYFMFIGPTEGKKQEVRSRNNTPRDGVPGAGAMSSWSAWWNWDIAMGYLLVLMNFFMQSVLLFLIFEEVVIQNVEWQNGIMKLGGNGDHIMRLVAESPGECNDGGALCFHDHHGDYTCAPPSVQLVGRWEELDTNKDGIWQKEEVIAKQKELKCKYVVDPVVVFEVLISMLKEREDKIWLAPSIKNGSAIQLPYFTYIMSDVIMCGYRSVDMCSNLLERGYFHAPLKYGTSPRVGNTIDSALKYCRALLGPGGACERNLPSTYAVWKITSAGECGTPEYEQFKYTNPGNNSTKSLLKVDYSARLEYELAQEFLFNLFKGIIVFTWLLAMTSEFRDIIKILTLCARYPDAVLFGDDAVIVEVDPADPEDVRYRIQGITKRHRYIMIVLCILRFLIICVLMVVGVSYLMKTNDYADLIMNGVALGFIADVSGVLYSMVLREEVKDQTGDIKPIKVEMYGFDYLNRRPALIDLLCVIGISCVVLAIMLWQINNIVVPVHTALECTCLSQGETCYEAQKYNYDFWHEYWLHKIPQTFQDIDKIKADTLGAQGASFIMTSAASLSAEISAGEERFAKVMNDIAQDMKVVDDIRHEAHAGRGDGVKTSTQASTPAVGTPRRPRRRQPPVREHIRKG